MWGKRLETLLGDLKHPLILLSCQKKCKLAVDSLAKGGVNHDSFIINYFFSLFPTFEVLWMLHFGFRPFESLNMSYHVSSY